MKRSNLKDQMPCKGLFSQLVMLVLLLLANNFAIVSKHLVRINLLFLNGNMKQLTQPLRNFIRTLIISFAN